MTRRLFPDWERPPSQLFFLHPFFAFPNGGGPGVWALRLHHHDDRCFVSRKSPSFRSIFLISCNRVYVNMQLIWCGFLFGARNLLPLGWVASLPLGYNPGYAVIEIYFRVGLCRWVILVQIPASPTVGSIAKIIPITSNESLQYIQVTPARHPSTKTPVRHSRNPSINKSLLAPQLTPQYHNQHYACGS